MQQNVDLHRKPHCNTNAKASELEQPSIFPFIEIRTWNGYEYEIVNDRKSWPDAEQYCVDRGGHLTSITSQAENEFLT